MTRFVYIHGNGTLHWSFAFAPWLKKSLEDRGHETFFETMPDSIAAHRKYWLRFLDDIVKVQPDDVIIGWSSGAVAGMRYAETHNVAGLILIGVHYTDLGYGDEKESGYFEEEWDWESIRKNVGTIALFHGDKDPYIPTEDFLHIGVMTRADRHEIEGAGHFEESTEIPQLLELIDAQF